MTGRQARAPFPPEVEAVVHEVLAAADLSMVDGRADVERELRAHFEDGLESGTPPDELIRRFGDPSSAGRRIARTRPRAAAVHRGETGRWWMSLHEWWTELRRGARRLRRAPGFSAIVVLTLGLGVGANTAIFTALNAVLLEELPYAEPDRLVRVYESNIEDPTFLGFLRAPVFREYREWDEVFESIAAVYTYREVGADLTDGDAPRRVTVLRVSAGYFETLGVAPARGRTFLDDESFGPGESRGSIDLIAAVALISDGLWREHFGGDPEIIGRIARLDGASFEVVGVMPPRFADPLGSSADVWIPQDVRSGGSNNFGNFYLSAFGRLRPGMTLETAQDRLRQLAAAYGEVEPEVSNAFPRIFALQDDIVGSTRATMLWMLAVAAALVLLTACVNVANLLFARGLGQDRQLALRSALGSGRARLLAGILTENGLLAVLGGIAGVGIGWLGLRGLAVVAPDALPSAVELEMGWRVFAFALAVTAMALVAFGVTPAVRLSRTAPAEVLRSGDRAASGSRLARRMRDGLVIVQVGTALVLVSGASLLARSFDALANVPIGVEADGVLTFEVHLPGARYPEGAAREAFHAELHERIRDLPGVAAVGATSWLPVQGRYHSWGFQWSPSVADGSQEADWNPTDVRIVAGDYFDALGIEVRRGPSPSDVDYAGEPVLWINETIATEVFGDVDAVGRQVWMNGAARRVVGIIEDIPFGARGETSRKLYLPHAQFSDNRNWALIQTVKARGDLGELRASVGEVIQALDGQLVLYKPQPFGQILSGARAQDRFATVLMGAFAFLALLLSLLGTYGVLAGSVASRTREFGIRVALGADPVRMRNLVVRYAAAITLPGIALGLLGTWVAGRWIESLLFAVEPGDPVSYAAAVTVFVLVAALACWVPVRRAVGVDTVEALTAD